MRDWRSLAGLLAFVSYGVGCYATLVLVLLAEWPGLTIWNWPIAILHGAVAAFFWPLYWVAVHG